MHTKGIVAAAQLSFAAFLRNKALSENYVSQCRLVRRVLRVAAAAARGIPSHLARRITIGPGRRRLHLRLSGSTPFTLILVRADATLPSATRPAAASNTCRADQTRANVRYVERDLRDCDDLFVPASVAIAAAETRKCPGRGATATPNRGEYSTTVIRSQEAADPGRAR